ncbi:unnamed protein product [Peronospora belbahrii]|uniref:Secreted protein n=1 Tax=Peronospora belbahrii TaxID=622444 RepID=A0ABN8CZF8_9STRA|nr:unnamed protein product [Peronospora belbahrii]
MRFAISTNSNRTVMHISAFLAMSSYVNTFNHVLCANMWYERSMDCCHQHGVFPHEAASLGVMTWCKCSRVAYVALRKSNAESIIN